MSPNTLRASIKRFYNLPDQRKIRRQSPEQAAKDRNIATAYAEGKTAMVIANMFGMTEQSVYAAIRRYKARHPHADIDTQNKRVSQKRTRAMVDEIRAGSTFAQVAAKYGVTRQRVHQLVNQFYIDHPDAAAVEGKKIPDFQKERADWIVSMYERGLSPDEIILGSTMTLSEVTAALDGAQAPQGRPQTATGHGNQM